MNKKIGILFVFYFFYKIYKSKNKLLFFIFRLTSKGNKYIKNKQLKAFKHKGFWSPMDTLNDKNKLEDIWSSKKVSWKKWNE